MQGGRKGPVASLLRASTRAADLTARAAQAVKGLLPFCGDSKLAAAHIASALQMLLRAGKRALGALKGFLPFNPCPQPPPTQERVRARRHSMKVRGLSAQPGAAKCCPKDCAECTECVVMLLGSAYIPQRVIVAPAGLRGALLCEMQLALAAVSITCSGKRVLEPNGSCNV